MALATIGLRCWNDLGKSEEGHVPGRWICPDTRSRFTMFFQDGDEDEEDEEEDEAGPPEGYEDEDEDEDEAGSEVGEGEEEVGLSYLMKEEIQVNGNLLFALKTVGTGLSAVRSRL